MKSLNQILDMANSESSNPPNKDLAMELKKLEEEKVIYFSESYKMWSIVLGKGNVAKADILSFNL